MGERPRLAVRSTQTRASNEPIYHSSVFHITINSNRKPRTIQQRNQMVETYSQLIDEQFQDDEFMFDSGFIRVLRPGDNLTQIKTIDTTFAVEQGRKRGRIHAHVTVEVIHSTKIRLDPLILVNKLEDQLGYRPYVHIQGSSNPTFNLREYAAKNNLASNLVPRTPANSPLPLRRRLPTK